MKKGAVAAFVCLIIVTIMFALSMKKQPQAVVVKAVVVIHARLLGVIADGLTDDTKAVQRCLDLVADIERQGVNARLDLPPGDISITHTLHIESATVVYGGGDKK